MAQGATGFESELAEYLDSLVNEPSAVFSDLRAHIDATLPAPIQISPHQGRFLAWLTRAVGVSRVLEVGTFAGYSTLWFAWALGKKGRIVTLEREANRSATAKVWHEKANLGCEIDYKVGEAAELLAGIADDSFDLAFIDADKRIYPELLESCIRCVRSGGLIVADNVFHYGGLLTPNPGPSEKGILEYNSCAVTDSRLSSVLVPLGDGLMVSTVL